VTVTVDHSRSISIALDLQIGNPRGVQERGILKSWRELARREAADTVRQFEYSMSIEATSAGQEMVSRGDIDAEFSETGSMEGDYQEVEMVDRGCQDDEVVDVCAGKEMNCDWVERIGDRDPFVEQAGASPLETADQNRRPDDMGGEIAENREQSIVSHKDPGVSLFRAPVLSDSVDVGLLAPPAAEEVLRGGIETSPRN
jgi:hypothetical protein